MKAEFIFGKHKKLGKILIITFPNKSKIYATKKGITFTIPYSEKLVKEYKKRKNIELTASTQELDILMKALKKAKW